MRPGTGCQSCRLRHLKCALQEGQSSCTRCLEAGRKCEFLPRYRFRQVSHVDTASSGLRSRTELQYESHQPWVSTANPVSFVFEDGLGIEYAGSGFDGAEMDETQLSLGNESAGLDGRADDADTLNGGDAGLDQETMAPWESLDEPDIVPDALNVAAAASNARPSYMAPASVPELTRRYVFGVTGSVLSPSSPFGHSAHSNTTSPATSLPGSGSARLKLTRREAFLLHHYINKLAPWIDCCDLLSQFGLEVPRRASRKPIVLFSLLAFASIHQAIMNGQPRHEASFYHGECLRLLIEALSDAEAAYDDNLLASVIFLRLYEEIEGSTDDYHHLRGLGRLLNAIPTFAHSGGLAEAACWQSLRQDIYIALLKAQPPTIELANYDQSSALRFTDEGACANVIVLLFAKVLRLTYSSAETLLPDTWTSLEADIEIWNERRFRLFQPIFEESADPDGGKPFPVCCMTNAPQVVALQHYYSCVLFLLLHRPAPNTFSSFEKAKHRRSAEAREHYLHSLSKLTPLQKSITAYLAVIIGLAESNDTVENANFTAEHLLRTCGYCIVHPVQRRGALDFLVRMQRLMGWNTEETSNLLQSQWRDLDNPDG